MADVISYSLRFKLFPVFVLVCPRFWLSSPESIRLSESMTKFRPCIDLHEGRVKQIVGGSLTEGEDGLQTNFSSDRPAGYYANIYKNDGLVGGHVIQLGAGNEAAAREALAAYPNGLQVGGGIRIENAVDWLQAGASHVIVTSWLFDGSGHFLPGRLDQLVAEVGKDRLVLDLSCRASAGGWVVAMNRWQAQTDMMVDPATIEELSGSCDEFLVHAADIEGKCEGIDQELVTLPGSALRHPRDLCGWCPFVG
jgi:phosphoribosylformimino-5-aminoimidazole carboxamide ribotide isomerase